MPKVVPIEECVKKTLSLCGAARKKILQVKNKLSLAGHRATDELVINKMLREFPIT